MAMDERWWMEGVGWMDIEQTNGGWTNVGRMDVRCSTVDRPGALQRWCVEANLNFYFFT